MTGFTCPGLSHGSGPCSLAVQLLSVISDDLDVAFSGSGLLCSSCELCPKIEPWPWERVP